MSKLDQIATFLQVVESHGFAAAGKKLHISTAAISRQVTQLETDLGAQLLIRTTRHLSLTEVGMLYYQECKKLLETLRETETIITGSQKEASGKLHIMANRYFASEFILPRLSSFLTQHPKLRINLTLAERFPDFMQENIDILFGVSLEGSSSLVRRKIAETHYVLCASPNYLHKFGTPKTTADLYQHRYIAHSERKPHDVIIFNDNKEFFIEPYLQLNDSFAIRECALKGMGIVRLHSYIVEEDIQKGKLVSLLPDYPFETTNIYLYYQQSRYLQPKIRQFIDYMLEV